MGKFIELINKRKSIRKYLDKAVERDLIVQCVEAARLAPSACNSQPWRFLVIDNKEIIETVKSAAFSGVYSPMKWVCKAPVIVVIMAELDVMTNFIGRSIQGTSYYLIDCGIAGEHFVLQAEELGLSTCWIGWFNSKQLKKVLKLKFKPVAIISLGYGAGTAKPTKRKSINDITHFNQW